MPRLVLFALAFFLALAAHAANPRVEVNTSQGTLTLELFADKAPRTVENFLLYVKEGFFDGTIFHRYYLRPKPVLRIIKTMLEDKDVCVRRLREGYEFFKSMAQRRSDLAAAKSVSASA